jgi:uncharacterized membrane protein YraQ (UPF0718 family)
MADVTQPAPRPALWRRIDPVWAAIPTIALATWLLDPDQAGAVIGLGAAAFLRTLPYILFAILAIGYLKASSAETLISRAFTGNQTRMIVLAALVGGLSPFCSCQVIPFIATLLAVGAPLSAVMAFWLSSPLMDPAMFSVTAGTLGLPFALAKTVAAIGLGLFGGFAVRALAGSALFADPLKPRPGTGSCCRKGLNGQPVWRFWVAEDRRRTFAATTADNALFLGKWLMLAYLLEGLMITYVPAEWIAGVVGGAGIGPILTGALVGAPAYLNGYAAVPLIDGLLHQGMSQGAAMAFMIAGGVSSIPAAIAVWALVKPRVFAAYLGLAVIGAVMAGLVWGAVAL